MPACLSASLQDLLNLPRVGSAASCEAQRLLIARQLRSDCSARDGTIGLVADVLAGTGLGSRWTSLIEAIEWAASKPGRHVSPIDGPGTSGVPWLTRPGCAFASERCWFLPYASCDASDGRRTLGWVKWDLDVYGPRVGGVNGDEGYRPNFFWMPRVPASLGARSLLWWQSQITGFFLQPRPETIELLNGWLAGRHRASNHEQRRTAYSGWAALRPYASVHIRWGDKCTHEARCRDVADFAAAAWGLQRRFGVKRLVLSSESSRAVGEMAQALGNRSWDVSWPVGATSNPFVHSSRSFFRAYNHTHQAAAQRREMEAMSQQGIISLYASAAADYIVCTPSSNWCRIILRLAYFLRGGEALPRLVLMDRWGNDFSLSWAEALKDRAFNASIVHAAE